MGHLLHRSMSLPLDWEELFPFFADPGNLARITPPELGFEILTPGPIVMEEGALLDYRLRVAGVPVRWRTRIAAWEPPRYFVDEQLRGPYAEWVHRHEFRPTAEGTEMRDEVRYRLPLGALGRLAHPIVRRQLDRIFDFRARVIREILANGELQTGV